MSEESPAIKLTRAIGDLLVEAASEVDPETAIIVLACHIGNVLPYCSDTSILGKALEVIQEVNNDNENSVKMVVESASSEEEMQEKIDALKEKDSSNDLH